MKRVLVLIAATTAIVACQSRADRDKTVTKTADSTSQEALNSAEQTIVVGVVSNVKSDSFHVKTDDGKQVKLQYPKDTTAQKEQVKEGDEVRASYGVVDGDNIIRIVHVLRTPPASPMQPDQNTAAPDTTLPSNDMKNR